MGFAIASGSWEDAERLVGSVIGTMEGAEPVSRVAVRRVLEAIEWGDPGLFEDHDGDFAPSSMYLTFAMPAYWKPGDPPLRDPVLPPFPLRNIPAPGNTYMATESEVEFFKPMRFGDRLSAEWRLVKLTRKRTAVGDGAFLVLEITFADQDDERVAVEHLTVFRYQEEG